MKKKPNSQDECGVGERGGIIVCGLLPPSADSFHRPRTPSTARGLLPPPAGGPPPSKREVLGFRRSKPAALPSIAYRGFAVAPITLRASSRRVVVITSGTNGRAMRAPTGYGDAAVGCNDKTQRCKCISSLRFPPRCRGAHCAPADILPTFDFPIPRPPSKREVWGFRRSRPAALPAIAYRSFAVAPMTLRASSRSLLYNPGCRVATLLVSKGVMGFLGDLRGKNRNFPLIP